MGDEICLVTNTKDLEGVQGIIEMPYSSFIAMNGQFRHDLENILIIHPLILLIFSIQEISLLLVLFKKKLLSHHRTHLWLFVNNAKPNKKLTGYPLSTLNKHFGAHNSYIVKVYFNIFKKVLVATVATL